MMDPVQNIGTPFLIVAIVLGAVATLFVITRLIVRLTLLKHFGPDDYAIALAGAVNIAFTVIWVLEVRYGVGKHVKTLSPVDASNAVRLQLVQVCLSLWIMIFVKISLSLLLIRIGIGKIWKWILGVCIGVFVVITVINMAFVIGRCTPIQSLWDPTVNGTCILTPAQLSYNNNAQIAFAILTDILLTLAPAMMVWKLHMAMGTKFLLIGLFALGLLTTVCAVLKVVYLTAFDNGGFEDFTYETVMLNYWVVMEPEVAIIAACTPAIRALFTKASFFQSTTGSKSSQPRTYGSQLESADIKVVTSVEWAANQYSEK